MSRIEELYKIIEDAGKEISEIRDNCPHVKYTNTTYMLRVGKLETGCVCDDCGEFLGLMKTPKEWIKNPNWRESDYTQNEQYLLSREYSEDEISWKQFMKLVDYTNVGKNAKNWHKANALKIEVGDLIQERGKPIVRCIKILGDDLLWESLDGKSSACDSIIEFNLVSKKPIR